MTDPAAQDLLMELRALLGSVRGGRLRDGLFQLVLPSPLPLLGLEDRQNFVADMMDSPHARTIVFAVLSLARELGLVAIAEGVESGQSQLLAEQGCELVQRFGATRA